MQIDSELHKQLCNILSRVPIARSKDGRDTLLVGIPQNGWERSSDLDIDIHKIITQATDIFAGKNECIETWGLLFLIKNAIEKTSSTSLETELSNIRTRCIEYWQQKQIQSNSIASSNLPLPPIRPNVYQEPRSVPSLTPTADAQLLSMREPPDLQSESSTHRSFFTQFDRYIEDIRSSFTISYQPFKGLPVGYAEYAECRKTIKHLKQIIHTLPQLSMLLKATIPLPSSLSHHYPALIERINTLLEQCSSLIERIERADSTDKMIYTKFMSIEQELTSIYSIQSLPREKLKNEEYM